MTGTDTVVVSMRRWGMTFRSRTRSLLNPFDPPLDRWCLLSSGLITAGAVLTSEVGWTWLALSVLGLIGLPLARARQLRRSTDADQSRRVLNDAFYDWRTGPPSIIAVAAVWVGILVFGIHTAIGATLIVVGGITVFTLPTLHDRRHLRRGEAPHAMWGKDDKNRPPLLGGPRVSEDAERSRKD